MANVVISYTGWLVSQCFAGKSGYGFKKTAVEMHVSIRYVKCTSVFSKSAVIIDKFLGIINLEFIVSIDTGA